MRRVNVIILWLALGSSIAAQDSTNQKRDVDTSVLIHKRVVIVTVANIVAYGGTMVALYSAWYKNYPQSNFHFFNDNKEWLQVDKAGHAWSAYSEGRVSIQMWRWTGIADKTAIWLGGLSGLAYQSIIEILDGFSAEWGFSWGDYVANVAGSTLLIGQELGWKQQKIILKFSSHWKTYADDVLNQRADEIYGTNLPERILKDYNAQTFWLSVNIRSFFNDVNLPKWLNFSFGYGAEGMFGAVDNKWTSVDGNTVDRTDVKRYRQFYLAPDIDLTKIKTKSKFLRSGLFILNSFKFPTPSLEFSNKKISWNWLHF